jgi:probable F420-dependent oxidoreductase
LNGTGSRTGYEGDSLAKQESDAAIQSEANRERAVGRPHGLGVTNVQFAYGIPLTSPLNPEFSTAPAITALARQAEEAGFAAGYGTEHPIPSQRWRERGGHDALDPFVLLAVMSQATTTLRLLTNLTVVPYRNPFLLAKASATLDILSGGRLILGAGVGYLKAEFAALGIDYGTRNERFDEYLHVLKLAWAGGSIDFEGQFVNARGVTAYPPTLQRPHPPIWLGGNSKLTRRRVAEQADGWMPMPAPRGTSAVPLETVEDLVEMLGYLRSYAASIDRREPMDVMCVLPDPLAGGDARPTLEMVQYLSEAGVTWLAVNGSGQTLAEALSFIERFGDDVIARL